MFDPRPVLFLDGILLVILGVAMAIPGAFGPWTGGGDGAVFLGCSAATLFLGGAMSLTAMPKGRLRLDVRQSFLLAVSGVTLCIVCAAFPLRFASPHLSFVDAVFEAASGLTTTGATVITGLDQTAPAILVWRALLNWLGGIGIIIMAAVLLPALKVGGMQMFRLDGIDHAGSLRLRVMTSSAMVLAVYGSASIAAAIAFYWAGMVPFDAICHAMSAISTGGFSTSDGSLRHWGPAVQWVAVVTMIAGASPLPLVILAQRRHGKAGVIDEQLWFYLAALAAFSIMLGVWRLWTGAHWSEDLLRTAVFTAVSLITTTGFVVADYSVWGGFIHIAFFLMAFIGGCTGSAGGAIKIFRWQILAQITRIQINRLSLPHRIMPITFNHRAVDEDVTDSVLAFVVLYLLTYAACAAVIAAMGLDIVTALSGSAAAIGNVGRGIGDIIGPTGNWRSIPPSAKWVLCFEMIAGRLELLTVFVLFTPKFWKE